MALHIETPFLPVASDIGAGRELWAKMESMQPAGSFKLRGLGALCEEEVARGARRLVSSSGGNAGYATAWAGRALGVPVTVVVFETTGAAVRKKLAAVGAAVRVHGAGWDDAHAEAERIAAETGGTLIHPFDHPTLWRGHATMIEEMARQGPRPDAVVLAVGGGGLMLGVIQGLNDVGWSDVPVVAVETKGAASLAAAIVAGRAVTLDRIDSIALTLGARRVADAALAACRTHSVRSVVVSDHEAIAACIRFADETRVLVEPACGAALAGIYENASALVHARRIAVIACGGIGISLKQLREWSARFGVEAA
ncbi:MAG: pyridoxal-phosphate dependent enzyme [Rhodanobacteraceae bacterium]